MLIAKLEKKPNFRTENVDRIDEKKTISITISLSGPNLGGKPHGNWKNTHSAAICFMPHTAHWVFSISKWIRK